MSFPRDAVAGPGIDLDDPFLLDFVSDKSSKIGPFEIADDYPFDFVPSARKTLAIRSWVSGRLGCVPWMDIAIAILNLIYKNQRHLGLVAKKTAQPSLAGTIARN